MLTILNKIEKSINRVQGTLTGCILLAAGLCATTDALAQSGAPWIHDPSTLAYCDGKWYTFGTGGGGLISADGWHWQGGAVRPGGGAAPDVVKIGNRYLVSYSGTGGGLGGGHNGRILTMWTKSLDPTSALCHYTEAQEVIASDGDEDNDAIDPGLLLDPVTGRLWVSYGTYFGHIRLVELDKETGARKDGTPVTDIAIDCEATDLIYRNGWYYLLGTHGTCCDGVNSTYNIVVGRSRQVQGPYLDNVDRSMLQGGGKMVIHAGDRKTGPGHFGRTIIDEGVEVMSCHYEADYDQSGRSVLGIRPLLWTNDWPTAGDRLSEGSYYLESQRHGYALELSVDFVRQQVARQRHWGIDPNETIKPLPLQSLADVQSTWPTGPTGIRMGDYMFRPHQQWVITAVPEAGGYLSNPYFKITISGTNRALAISEDCEVISVPEYTGGDQQLWRIEQCTDGSFRIMPKRLPDAPTDNTEYVLYAAGDSTPILAKWDFKSDNAKWLLRPSTH